MVLCVFLVCTGENVMQHNFICIIGTDIEFGWRWPSEGRQQSLVQEKMSCNITSSASSARTSNLVGGGLVRAANKAKARSQRKMILEFRCQGSVKNVRGIPETARAYSMHECCFCCDINSHNQVRDHGTGSSHSGMQYNRPRLR